MFMGKKLYYQSASLHLGVQRLLVNLLLGGRAVVDVDYM